MKVRITHPKVSRKFKHIAAVADKIFEAVVLLEVEGFFQIFPIAPHLRERTAHPSSEIFACHQKSMWVVSLRKELTIVICIWKFPIRQSLETPLQDPVDRVRSSCGFKDVCNSQHGKHNSAIRSTLLQGH